MHEKAYAGNKKNMGTMTEAEFKREHGKQNEEVRNLRSRNLPNEKLDSDSCMRRHMLEIRKIWAL